jgi:hypothetical protein
MAIDYDTVGQFYQTMEFALNHMAEKLGEDALFCGDPALQLSPAEIDLKGVKPVLCAKTAVAACAAIITEGEGATAENSNSHFCRFRAIRDEYQTLLAKNPSFTPAHPAATNPVLRRPPFAEGRVWLEDADASAIVDVANAVYQTTVRPLAYAYAVAGPSAEKSLAVDLGIDLMKAMTLLAESAARRPAGPSNPHCNAGMSFTALRDSAPLPANAGTRLFFTERLRELAEYAGRLPDGDTRIARATGLLKALAVRAERFTSFRSELAPARAARPAEPQSPPPAMMVDGDEVVEGKRFRSLTTASSASIRASA